MSETSPRVQTGAPHRAPLCAADDRARRRPTARCGDVLVLVRQRGALFEAIIRALKNEGVAVAGADRLVLTEHIAVMDLMALADALLLPQDDLALATVLRSPLFGFSDDDLFAIAWERGRARCARRWRENAGEDKNFADAPLASMSWRRPRGARRRLRSSPAARRGRRAAALSWPARRRGQRRARRISQSRARLRAARHAVVAGLSRLAARCPSRGQARHGNRPRRGARHDRARRQGS